MYIDCFEPISAGATLSLSVLKGISDAIYVNLDVIELWYQDCGSLAKYSANYWLPHRDFTMLYHEIYSGIAHSKAVGSITSKDMLGVDA